MIADASDSTPMTISSPPGHHVRIASPGPAWQEVSCLMVRSRDVDGQSPDRHRGPREIMMMLDFPENPDTATSPSGVRHLVLAGMVGSVVVAYLSRTVLA